METMNCYDMAFSRFWLSLTASLSLLVKMSNTTSVFGSMLTRVESYFREGFREKETEAVNRLWATLTPRKKSPPDCHGVELSLRLRDSDAIFISDKWRNFKIAAPLSTPQLSCARPPSVI